MKQFTIIATTVIITLLCFAASYSIEMGRLRTTDLERQVEINQNAIHRLVTQEHAKCQCGKEPAQQ